MPTGTAGQHPIDVTATLPKVDRKCGVTCNYPNCCLPPELFVSLPRAEIVGEKSKAKDVSNQDWNFLRHRNDDTAL